MKVFGLPTATDVARVLTCLFEKDVDFQLIRIDAYKGQPRVPEFLRLQDPTGQVTLKDNKKILMDSREICRYIEEKHENSGTKGLLGTGTLERALIEQWLQSESENFEPLSSTLVFNLAFALPMGIKCDEDLTNKHEEELSKMLDVYDKRLAVSEYLAGDEFTMADLSHIPNSHYLVSRSERGRKLFVERKNVSRWWTLISKRASWLKVVQLQSEHPGPADPKFEG